MENVKIDTNKCKGCTLCVTACPKKCLQISKTFNKAGYHPAVLVDDDKCTSCGFCYQICPEYCIEVHKK